MEVSGARMNYLQAIDYEEHPFNSCNPFDSGKINPRPGSKKRASRRSAACIQKQLDKAAGAHPQ